jgi:GTP cyclohydrolase II
VPVYLHRTCCGGDVFSAIACTCRKKLHTALDALERCETGVVVYLGSAPSRTAPEDGAWRHLTQPATPTEWLSATTRHADRWRSAIAAHILRDLGVERVTALHPGDAAVRDLSAYGLSVVPSDA